MTGGPDGREPDGRERDDRDLGGDTACWLSRVCDACGALSDAPSSTVCERCGADLPAP